jgi:hypothetical protein
VRRDTWHTAKITTVPVRAQRRTVESVWRRLPAEGRQHLFFALRRLFRTAKSYAVRCLSPRRTAKVFATQKCVVRPLPCAWAKSALQRLCRADSSTRQRAWIR